MKRFCIILTAFILITFGRGSLAEDQTVILSVENMTCSLCPVTVRKALKDTDGVYEAKVSLELENAVVTFDDEKTDVETLIAVTTNAGFPSTFNQEEQSDDDKHP